MKMKRLLLLSYLATATACAPAVATAPAASPAPAAAGGPTGASQAPPSATPTAIRWTRGSAEHRAIFLQTYAWASQQLRQMAAGAQGGAWGVILDADETVLDNSTYQLGHPVYSDTAWNAWVRQEAATALPGAAEFTQLAHQLGGKVAIVTNRDVAVCPETIDNLRRVGIAFDAVLCKPAGPGDKNPRFQAVQNGTAAPGLPALRVLMWVGDNIQDFPALSQDVRNAPDAAFAPFGRTFIVLPNPMYGSWEHNPPQ
jgi:5'-nucleotidase (lipoprotein e(P4) family)